MVVEFKEPNFNTKHLLHGEFCCCSVEELVLLFQSTKVTSLSELILWTLVQKDEGQALWDSSDSETRGRLV